jgi:hypothetical protein
MHTTRVYSDVAEVPPNEAPVAMTTPGVSLDPGIPAEGGRGRVGLFVSPGQSASVRSDAAPTATASIPKASEIMENARVSEDDGVSATKGDNPNVARTGGISVLKTTGITPETDPTGPVGEGKSKTT